MLTVPVSRPTVAFCYWSVERDTGPATMEAAKLQTLATVPHDASGQYLGPALPTRSGDVPARALTMITGRLYFHHFSRADLALAAASLLWCSIGLA